MSENVPVVLVTGVGPGTGAAISRRFALGGYRVAMLARTRERLEALQRELPNAKGYPCDVTDETQLDSVIEAVRRDLGAPKVLVHNAVGGSFGNFMEIDPKVLNGNFQVNTMALLYLARGLAPAMVEAGEGAIVATGNTSALRENLASRDSLPPRRRNVSSPNLSPENCNRRASMSPTL
jgi:NAD(P)-dependent dehydrogenase (short-subunit alcohol dehydrogenase family)